MLIYTVKRIGLALLIVLVAMTMLFSMIYLVPGDPASIALGPRATPEMKAALLAFRDGGGPRRGSFVRS